MLGGTLAREGDKIVDLINWGIRPRIPIVGIQDSRRPYPGRCRRVAQYGRIFKKTRRPRVWPPDFDHSGSGGRSLQPALTDFIVMTRENPCLQTVSRCRRDDG